MISITWVVQVRQEKDFACVNPDHGVRSGRAPSCVGGERNSAPGYLGDRFSKRIMRDLQKSVIGQEVCKRHIEMTRRRTGRMPRPSETGGVKLLGQA
jgi:hypothetical protein